MVEAPKKERINLNDGLPKKSAYEIIDELKSFLYSDDNLLRFFPPEKEYIFLKKDIFCKIVFSIIVKNLSQFQSF